MAVETRYYEILDVEVDASDQEIRRVSRARFVGTLLF